MTYLHWLVVLSAAFVVAERMRPRQRRGLLRPGTGTDLFYLVFNGHFLGVLAAWAGTPLAARADAMFDRAGLALSLASSWPAWAQFVVAFVSVDLLHWCIHNLLHRVPLLWRFHQVHHSIEHLDWLGSLRFHWAEGLFYKVLTYPVLASLGIDAGVLLALAVVNTLAGHFNHSNLSASLGPLRYVVNGPEMHVWHHARLTDDVPARNFGITLSAWDWLFGTASLPPGVPARLGFAGDEAFPRSVVGHMLHPIPGPWRRTFVAPQPERRLP